LGKNKKGCNKLYSMKKFLEWIKLREMVGTGAVYDSKVKPRTFNWWGQPGSTGTSIEGYPIGTKGDKKSKRKKNES
jgi:hypothetical protein